jgi:hypothetical protein
VQIVRAMLRETFRFRRGRGCTQNDAASVASNLRLRADLTPAQSEELQALLYVLCRERCSKVVIEVTAAA